MIPRHFEPRKHQKPGNKTREHFYKKTFDTEMTQSPQVTFSQNDFDVR